MLYKGAKQASKAKQEARSKNLKRSKKQRSKS
jgi:hypothetical protein